MTLQVKMEMLLANDKWERQLKATEKKLKGFEKTTKQISGAIKTAWVAVAAFGINVVGDAIRDAAKAAAEDNRSMALLNEQMRRTWHGNEELNKSIDKQIDNMANLTGIADDKLRPALIRIAAVTKNPKKGMSMLGLATDIAAKSGSDLVLVSKNMAKFLGGNKTALDKLVPGLAKAGDKMKFLEKNYRGFAEISGANDPFARIDIIMQNFQEKIGKAFLPLTNQFADWLAGPDAQKAMDQLAQWVSDTFAWFQSPEGKAQMKEWYDQAKLLVEELVYVIDKFAEFLGMLDGKTDPTRAKAETGGRGNQYKSWSMWDSPAPAPVYQTGWAGKSSFGGVTNITINATNASGTEVVNAMKNEARRRGIPVNKLVQ